MNSLTKEYLANNKPLQKRIICHWTVTSYEPDEVSKDSYHILIKGDGTVVPTIPLRYPAPHTYGFNSAIGISLCCMGGWNGSRTPYPPTKKQWDSLVAVVEQLCTEYDISVDKYHVLMHGEVHSTMGVDQWGKWDIGYLPFCGIEDNAKMCGDLLREEVADLGLKPIVDMRLEGSPRVLSGYLYDGSTLVSLREFVEWVNSVSEASDMLLISVQNSHRIYTLIKQPDVVGMSDGYTLIRGFGYASLRPITDYLGYEIVVEKWGRDKKILVIRKPR